MVGIFEGWTEGEVLGLLSVPTGYASGTALSDMATYSGKTLATLGVTPGTYVWTWGNGANQKFTLQIPPAPPPPTPTPSPTSTPTGPPIVATNPATNVAGFSATLNGTVNPNGLSTAVHFDYGITTNYGFSTATQTYQGSTTQNVSANVSGLTAGATYHFRIVASNSAGTTYGADRSFTTPAARAVVADFNGDSFSGLCASANEPA